MADNTQNSVNVPKIGMQLWKHPQDLENTEFSLLLNGNIQSSVGTFIKVSNEHSNLLCSRFKEGFKVIGILPINIQERTIYFLVNPETNESEIGEIKNISYSDKNDIEVFCKECKNSSLPDIPLEQVEQNANCTYSTIISASCLNFSINHPISATYEIGVDVLSGLPNCNTTIFFADDLNSRRFIDLENPPYILLGHEDNDCKIPIYSKDLDCNKIKVQRDYQELCISATDITTGGALSAGVYQFTGAYSTPIGIPITDYFLVTNPIPLYNKQRTITIQTDYPTDKSIKLQISNLDSKFSHFNLVVLKTINQTTTPFLIGTFPVQSDIFSYTYTGNNYENEVRLDIAEILRRRPIYDTAKTVITANKLLFWKGLKEQREINLQPSVNTLHPYWQTVQAPQDFYSDSINATNVGYCRDEVVPLSIYFKFNNGFKTADFLISGKDADYYQVNYSVDVNSTFPTNSPNVLPVSNCENVYRDKYWQIYNSGFKIGNSNCPPQGRGSCSYTPYEYGDFAYWESSLTYPNNPDVWGDLCGKPIRYTKFPDNCITHIHDNPTDNNFTTTNNIYPIGILIPIDEIKRVLNDAVDKGLISEQEKLQINGYGIKRANRRSNKSIIAKGLLYDVWKTPFLDGDGNILPDQSIQYFANFPYNDLHDNIFLNSIKIPNGSPPPTNIPIPIPHPFSPTLENNRYVFHSPNTHFNQPLLGSEIKLETVEYGVSRGQFVNVDDHSEYILLKQGGYTLAGILATSEALLEVLISGGNQISGTTVPNGIVIGIITSSLSNLFIYIQQWIDIIKKLGQRRNYASYYTSIGNYSNYCCVTKQEAVRFQSILTNGLYLQPGNIQFIENSENIYLNNVRRESSVYLSIAGDDKKFKPVQFFCPHEDNSRVNYPSCIGANQLPNLNSNIDSSISSFYISIKNYVPDQYGTPDQIEWLDTGYCGKIEWNNSSQDTACDTIFGGDTYINKFSHKIKFPFFTQERVGYGPDADVQYSLLGNVGSPVYFFDTLQDFTGDVFSNIGNAFKAPSTNLNCSGINSIYHRGTALLYSYGIPSYFCESDYNVDLRYGEDEWVKNFYPNIGDYKKWTQENTVSISNDNYYFYNQDYSKQNRENFYYTLRDDFDNSGILCRSEYPNRVIYSREGVPGWLSYSANDFFDFPLEDGAVIGINPIEQQAILVRQENSSSVFNAFITVQTDLADAQISTGNLFTIKPRQYFKSDLGFGGSTHTAFTSTPFGHFFVDTQNPSIFQLSNDNLRDITRGREGTDVNAKAWFRENLPFFISKDFPEVDIDNAFKYFGVSLCWDNKFDRLFITKKDAQLLPKFKDLVTYDSINTTFFYQNLPIEPTDSRYFCDRSWTIAYSPITGTFLSFYSFHPNYYVSTEGYFQSGVNFSSDSSEYGLWSHLLTNQSYQVFYGKLYPFIIEYATKDTLRNNFLENISYQAEFNRFEDNLSYYLDNSKTFNKALVYNQNQSTGILNLTVQQKNNQYQLLQYPKVNQFSTDILVSNIENNWRFNQALIDISQHNNQPLMIYECGKEFKDVNPKSLNYTPQFLKNKLRGDYFQVRLINDTLSNYAIITKFNIAKQTNSNT